MANVTDQNVPPELRDAYDAMVSPSDATAPSPPSVRARRSVKADNPNIDRRGAATALERIARGLADVLGINWRDPLNHAWLADRRRALAAGQIESEYWRPLEPITTEICHYAATSVEDLPRPPYDYQTDTNRPTRSAWAYAGADGAVPEYIGALDADLYEDHDWRTRRQVWELPAPLLLVDNSPYFALFEGSMGVASNNRPSRPMFSLLDQLQLAGTIPEFDADPAPPISPATSHYWRYRSPLGEPPYYTFSQPRRILQQLPRTLAAIAGNYLSINLGPRPMMGRANNNNATVHTIWSGTETLYAPAEPPPPPAYPIYIREYSGQWQTALHDLEADELQIIATTDFRPWRIRANGADVCCLDADSFATGNRYTLSVSAGAWLPTPGRPWLTQRMPDGLGYRLHGPQSIIANNAQTADHPELNYRYANETPLWWFDGDWSTQMLLLPYWASARWLWAIDYTTSPTYALYRLPWVLGPRNPDPVPHSPPQIAATIYGDNPSNLVILNRRAYLRPITGDWIATDGRAFVKNVPAPPTGWIATGQAYNNDLAYLMPAELW